MESVIDCLCADGVISEVDTINCFSEYPFGFNTILPFLLREVWLSDSEKRRIRAAIDRGIRARVSLAARRRAVMDRLRKGPIKFNS